MSENNIRAFVGLNVPQELRDQFTDLPRTVLKKTKWVNEFDLHITLRFLGYLSPEKLNEIEQALQHVRRPPFAMVVKGMNYFKRDKENLLHAHIESARKLTALYGDVMDRIVPLGVDLPTKEFNPHITFARSEGQEKALETYISRNSKKIGVSWSVKDFHLYRSSDPNEKGAKYKTLASFNLF